MSKDLNKLRSILCMNGNYSEVVRVIDALELSGEELLTILKQEVEA